MAKLWAQQILLGARTYAQTPRLLKAQVAQILEEQGRNDLLA